MGRRIAVVGVGNVGREALSSLAERGHAAADVTALATEAAVGQEISFGENDVLSVGVAAKFDFSDVDVVINAAGAKAGGDLMPTAVGAGAVVVDTSTHWRMNPEVPLVVPGVNPDAIAGYDEKGILAIPSAPTVLLTTALKPLFEAVGIRRVVVSTYQAVSDAGRAAMDELFTQTRAVYVNDSIEPREFSKQIAFNVIPHIGGFQDDGYTDEEWRLSVETRKVLSPQIKVTATCVRVPVFIGHALSVNVELDGPLTVDEAWEAWRETEGLTVIDHRANEGYVTPVEVAGDDPIFISRAREDFTVENGLSFWCVGDNLRAGAGLAAARIVGELFERWDR